MRHHVTLACAAFAGLAALPAAAEEAERYRLERTEDGYVRLDTTTGAMTLCREADGRLVCAPAAQETGSASEVESLRERLRLLEGRVAALESGGAPVAGLPPEEEFERGIGYMERFFRMFMGLVKEFEDEPRAAPEKPAPERT
ncbi:MAG: hypothetical protein M9895_16390 [Aquamicrobium sp.]|uniref:hypothetical protein n=1 Tax=Aquamicrobium sp. TaxID=1872579 RepID=UPI00349EFABE|nr:hypothetical protein [Aquamicrobium sp.]MCO5156406.1 hypothetical protein [Aquamicrobium sp.]